MMIFWWFLALLLGSVEIYRAHECDVFTYLDFYHALIGTSLYVKLLLYTRANLTCGQELSHHNLSAQPQFNLTKPTTFVVHGYRPTGAPPNWLNNIIEQLLARGDMNVLVVDWNRGAANINYLKVVTYSRHTADNLTAFIQNMQENGASLSSIHMIGLSLGAHITGFVGAKFNGKIGRITAVDPAGPQFNGKPPEDRLDPTDAQFVDVVHTDMDAFGFRKPLGHIDFYANGGADQPGCPLTILSGSSYFKCDHQRSVLLYLGSLNRTCNIRAFPCTSYTDFLDGLCMDCDQFKPAGCPVFGYDIIEWKESLVPLRQTKAFFTTNKQTPYCQTNYWVDIVTWNSDTRWGYITIKLHNGSEVTEATINHKASSFNKYSETRLLAQFEKDLQKVHKISIKFSRVNVFKPKYKLRVLRIRLTHLERKDRDGARFPPEVMLGIQAKEFNLDFIRSENLVSHGQECAKLSSRQRASLPL